MRESRRVDQQSRTGIGASLIRGFSDEAKDPSFYRQVDFSFIRGKNGFASRGSNGKRLPTDLFYSDLRNSRKFAKRFNSIKSQERQIQFIQRQYRGWRLSREDAETILSQINLHEMRSDLGGVHHYAMPENATWRRLFDQGGELKSGREKELLEVVFSDPQMNEKKLLQVRRASLIYNIIRLREERGPEKSAELDRLTTLAREVGLIDAQGEFVESPAKEQAMGEIALWREQRRQNGVTIRT